jgi:hypothetical protein
MKRGVVIHSVDRALGINIREGRPQPEPHRFRPLNPLEADAVRELTFLHTIIGVAKPAG